MAAKRKYSLSFNPVRVSKSYKADGAAVTFVNQGTSIAYVNQLRLIPGASFSVTANNPEDWDDTDYNITFTPTPGQENYLMMIRKSYKAH